MERRKGKKNGLKLVVVIVVVSLLAVATGYLLGTFMVGYITDQDDNPVVSEQPNEEQSLDKTELEQTLAGSVPDSTSNHQENSSPIGADLGSEQNAGNSGEDNTETGTVTNPQWESSGLFVQVASSSKLAYAEDAKRKIVNAGYEVVLKNSADGTIKILVPVDEVNKEQVRSELIKLGFDGAFFKQY